MHHQYSKTEKYHHVCGWFSCGQSKACRSATHQSSWAGVFFIISALSLAADLVPKWGLWKSCFDLTVICMQAFVGWFTLAISFYVAKGTLEFLDLAMNFAALAIIAQLDDYVFSSVRNKWFGVEFAAAVHAAAPNGITINIPNENHVNHKRFVNRLVFLSWIIVITSAVILAREACGRSLIHLLPDMHQFSMPHPQQVR